jgi:hypothetical protein
VLQVDPLAEVAYTGARLASKPTDTNRFELLTAMPNMLATVVEPFMVAGVVKETVGVGDVGAVPTYQPGPNLHPEPICIAIRYP